jgi:toxin ParE1/3/4
MAFTVVLRPQAEEDLAAIYEYVAQSNPQRAIEYLRRLRLRCEALTYFPERGRARDDLMPGARNAHIRPERSDHLAHRG